MKTFNGIDMASGVAVTDQWNFRVAVARLGGQDLLDLLGDVAPAAPT